MTERPNLSAACGAWTDHTGAHAHDHCTGAVALPAPRDRCACPCHVEPRRLIGTAPAPADTFERRYTATAWDYAYAVETPDGRIAAGAQFHTLEAAQAEADRLNALETDAGRFCPTCDADLIGNDPHAAGCPEEDDAQ